MKVFIVLLSLLSFSLSIKTTEKLEPISFLTCILKSEILMNDLKTIFKILSENDYENQSKLLSEILIRDIDELTKCSLYNTDIEGKKIKPIKDYKYEECMKNNYLCHQRCLITKIFNYADCINRCPKC